MNLNELDQLLALLQKYNVTGYKKDELELYMTGAPGNFTDFPTDEGTESEKDYSIDYSQMSKFTGEE